MPFQPTPATTISLDWLMPAVVPDDAVVLTPPAVAVTSSGADEAPARSTTVNARADAPLTVTVIVVTLAALAAYQISSSAWVPCVFPAALLQVFVPAESVMPVTEASTVVSRTLIAATRRSPVPLAVVVVAVRVVDADVFTAPKE